MAIDDDDLFEDDYDLVDDDFPEDDEAADEAAEESDKRKAKDKPPAKKKKVARTGGRRRQQTDSQSDADQPDSDAETADVAESDADEDLDEYGRPRPAANYVVHLYEHQKLTRTIDRPFTPEDAESFACEYNRTGKVYGRFAVAGKNDAKPKKSL